MLIQLIQKKNVQDIENQSAIKKQSNCIDLIGLSFRPILREIKPLSGYIVNPKLDLKY